MALDKVLDGLLAMTRKTGDVLYVEGPHGIGKSEMIAKWAEENGMHCIVLELATQEVGDLIGIPDKTDDGRTIWTKPDWMAEIEEYDAKGVPTLLFMDEVNRAQQDVKSATMNLVLNGRIHRHKLPKSTMIAAAANPSFGKYQVSIMDPAFMNRFCFMTLAVNPTLWLQYAREENLHKIVQLYITKNEEKLFNVDSKSAQPQTATPRSWTYLAHNLSFLEEVNADDDTIRTMIVGKVGTAIGGQFYNFYKENSKSFSAQDVIDFCSKYTLDLKSPKKYQEQIVEIADALQKEIEGVEHVVMQSIIDKLVDNVKHLTVTPKELESLEQKRHLLPIAVMMTAIPLEVAGSMLTQYKTTPEFKFLFMADVDSAVTRKCAAIKNKDNGWVK